MLRADYLKICNGNACAAALLNFYEYRLNAQIEQSEQLPNIPNGKVKIKRIAASLSYLRETVLLNQYSINTIRGAKKQLELHGFIHVAKSTTDNKGNGVDLVLLRVANVQKAIDSISQTLEFEEDLEEIDLNDTIDSPVSKMTYPPIKFDTPPVSKMTYPPIKFDTHNRVYNRVKREGNVILSKRTFFGKKSALGQMDENIETPNFDKSPALDSLSSVASSKKEKSCAKKEKSCGKKEKPRNYSSFTHHCEAHNLTELLKFETLPTNEAWDRLRKKYANLDAIMSKMNEYIIQTPSYLEKRSVFSQVLSQWAKKEPIALNIKRVFHAYNQARIRLFGQDADIAESIDGNDKNAIGYQCTMRDLIQVVTSKLKKEVLSSTEKEEQAIVGLEKIFSMLILTDVKTLSNFSVKFLLNNIDNFITSIKMRTNGTSKLGVSKTHQVVNELQGMTQADLRKYID